MAVPAMLTSSSPDPLRRSQSLYSGLAAEIRESGLLRRRYAYYWTRMALAVATFALVWVAFSFLGNSWFQLVVAGALGILMTQFGFLGHDAAHRQMFRSAAWNDWASRIMAGFAGLSYGWWKGKHNRHHAAPNQEGKDPDIARGTLAFTAALAEERTGFGAWFTARQGWLFFPLLTLEGINLHVVSVSPLFSRQATRAQRVESLLVALRLAAYVGVLLLVLPVGKAGAFLAVQSALFGLSLGASFAPNHKGMPIVPPEARIDFLRRQVLMSRNVRGGVVVDFALGGLNYQIEHHLFPSMPRPNLRAAQPLVRAYCDEHEVSYCETGLLESYGIVIDYLNHVGLRARSPFECPLVVDLRS